jgi:hypothetical protein
MFMNSASVLKICKHSDNAPLHRGFVELKGFFCGGGGGRRRSQFQRQQKKAGFFTYSVPRSASALKIEQKTRLWTAVYMQNIKEPCIQLYLYIYSSHCLESI